MGGQAGAWWDPPEGDVVEADAAAQRVGRDGSSSLQWHGGLQSQQLEDTGTSTQTPHHLWGDSRSTSWPPRPQLARREGGESSPRAPNPNPQPQGVPGSLTPPTWPIRMEMLAKDLGCTRAEIELRAVPRQAAGYRGARGTGGTIGSCPDLCTVCEATRKDMRSPGESWSPAIREPPTKMVPRTMPVGWGQSWDFKGTCRRGVRRRPCPRESHPTAPQVPLCGPCSPLSARLESPWKAAMPSPSRSLRCPARSTSARNSLRQGWAGVPSAARPPPPSSALPLTLPAAPPWQRRAPSARCPAPRRPPRWPWPPAG